MKTPTETKEQMVSRLDQSLADFVRTNFPNRPPVAVRNDEGQLILGWGLGAFTLWTHDMVAESDPWWTRSGNTPRAKAVMPVDNSTPPTGIILTYHGVSYGEVVGEIFQERDKPRIIIYWELNKVHVYYFPDKF